MRQIPGQIERIDSYIFILFSCWLLVDMINGYLLRSGFSLSVSQLYKPFVAIIIIIRLWHTPEIKLFFLCVLFYLVFYLLNIISIDGDISSTIVLLSKLLTTLLFFIYFLQIKKLNGLFFRKKATKVFKFSFIILAVNLSFGFWGIGFTSYGGVDGFGSRGFFYALNEISGLIAVIFPWAFYYCKRNFSSVRYYSFSLFLLFLAYTLSTKSGIVATFFSFMIITYFYGSLKERIIVIFFSFLLIIFIVYYIQVILLSEVPVVQRFSFFYEQNGLVDALTSSRLQYWDTEKKIFYNSDCLSWIFGLGGGRSVEMDPFDALLNCGLIGFFFLLYIYFTLIYMPLRRKSKYSKVVCCSNILLVVISIGGGHILFSSMAGMLIALSNAMIFGYYKESISERYIRALLLIKAIRK